jgi:hypothetical protein
MLLGNSSVVTARATLTGYEVAPSCDAAGRRPR